jgi:hypothetical protein
MPPSSAKAQIVHCAITVSVVPAVLKTTVATLAQLPFQFQNKKTDQTPALNLHRLTPPPVRTPPAVSSLEAFRTPASVHPLAPASGRHPKTLNDLRRSPRRSGTALIWHSAWSRPLILRFPSSVNWRRRSFPSAMLSNRALLEVVRLDASLGGGPLGQQALEDPPRDDAAVLADLDPGLRSAFHRKVRALMGSGASSLRPSPPAYPPSAGTRPRWFPPWR